MDATLAHFRRQADLKNSYKYEQLTMANQLKIMFKRLYKN